MPNVLIDSRAHAEMLADNWLKFLKPAAIPREQLVELFFDLNRSVTTLIYGQPFSEEARAEQQKAVERAE